MVDKLACFFSGGYTEAAGYMQLFLNKINDNYSYEQCIPNSTRVRKGMPKFIKDEYSGLSGDKLIEKMYEILAKPYIKAKFDTGFFSGVLLEDDLDGRFDYYETEQIEKWEQQISDEVCSIIGKKVPVFFIYASPEIEGWFVADWEGGFANFFLNGLDIPKIPVNDRKKFVFDLKKDVDIKMLSRGKIQIESYAHYRDEYHKFSEDLIELIDKRNIVFMDKIIKKDESIRRIKGFYYSKKEHGPRILKNIDPLNVKEICDSHFARSYRKLKNSEG